MKSLEIIFTLIAAILTAFVSYKWKNIDLLGKITLTTIIIAAIFIAINSFRQTKKENLIERVNAKFGELKLSESPNLVIQIGDKPGAVTFTSRTGVFNLMYMGSYLKLENKNGKLLINYIIRDLNGKVIGVLEDSVWTVFDNNYEYNNDDNAFEMVTKGERKVFWQINYKNNITVLNGFFLNIKGIGFATYGMVEGEGTKLYVMKSKVAHKNIPDNLNIPRIFKYPRGKYLGIKL